MQPAEKTPVLRVSETRGNPVTTPHGQLTPIARAVRLRWPGGGFTWNRAVAVEVFQEQEMRRVPVRDTTSRIIAAIGLSGLLVVATLASFLRRRRRTS
jgi:hypothetical protein